MYYKIMRYIKPKYYDKFECIAHECPDTCCAGWQIMIDEDSLEKYWKQEGAFGRRLRNSIDWQEGAFCQNNRRCAFLNDSNLCDLYTELGEGSLCETCKKYPRHEEEYEGLREWSLSLSCPVAAKLLLEEQDFVNFIEEENDMPDELEDEFEDFDLMLFTQLEDARAVVLKHLKEAEGTLEDKMSLYLQMAGQMQGCIDREAYFEIEDVIKRYDRMDLSQLQPTQAGRYEHMYTLLGYMQELERLRDEWSSVLDDLHHTLYAKGKQDYLESLREFEEYLEKDEKLAKQWEEIGERLFVFFLYTYFCGAVYDDWIYSKMALAVESVRFIRELYLAVWMQKRELTMEDYVKAAYGYAREIEHSDQNLNDLEEIFMKKIPC